MQIRRKKEILLLKQSLLFCPTRRRYGVLELMSRETMICERIQPKVMDYQWLSQCRPGDNEWSGRLRQGCGTRRAPGLAWLLLANWSPMIPS